LFTAGYIAPCKNFELSWETTKKEIYNIMLVLLSGFWSDFDEFRAVLRGYGARFSCRLENSKLPESRQIDCFDKMALEAAGYFPR